MALLQLMPHIQRTDCLTVRNYRISVSMNFSTPTHLHQADPTRETSTFAARPLSTFLVHLLKNNVHVEKGKFAIITNEQNAEYSMHACMHSGLRIHNR